MKDALGERMKHQYEDRYRILLPRRTYTIVRVDGRAFHSFTANAKKPFDRSIIFAMLETSRQLCHNLQGVRFAYTQSDEISLLLTDFEKEDSAAWFDGNLQKIASVAASEATANFIASISKSPYQTNKIPTFDARAFIIPDPVEVENYFIWRQKDARRNAVNSAAQSVFSHKKLHGKNYSEVVGMLATAGYSFDSEPRNVMQGYITKKEYRDWCYGNAWCVDFSTPLFTSNAPPGREYLTKLIPIQWEDECTSTNVRSV